MKVDKVGIVVVTFNRLKLLKEVVDSLRNQDYLNRDIIIVNNGSTDDTRDWLDNQNDLIVINQGNCGGAGGLSVKLLNWLSFCWELKQKKI